MTKTVTILLSLAERIEGHKGLISKIVLREPTFDEYLEIGDPYEIGESTDGFRFTVQNPEAVRAYIETCCVEPADPLLLSSASARVARKVRIAILNFFHDGDEAAEASKTSPTN